MDGGDGGDGGEGDPAARTEAATAIAMVVVARAAVVADRFEGGCAPSAPMVSRRGTRR